MTFPKFLTIIESPFAGDTERNLRYLKEAIRDSINRGEVPFASHLFYTQVLDDTIADQRRLGLHLGLQYYRAAKRCAVYEDYGVSHGMQQGIAMANANDVPIEHRQLRPIIDQTDT